MLVWFVHLPLVTMVALQIDLMWRYKIISGIEDIWKWFLTIKLIIFSLCNCTGFSASADLLAYGIVTRLMLQRRKNHFLGHESDLEFHDELEYYDDHSLNSETYTFSKANYRNNKQMYDNRISCDINTIHS